MRRAYLVAAWVLWGLLCLIVGAYLGRSPAPPQPLVYRPAKTTVANLLQCPPTAHALQEWYTDCRWRERTGRTKPPKGE